MKLTNVYDLTSVVDFKGEGVSTHNETGEQFVTNINFTAKIEEFNSKTGKVTLTLVPVDTITFNAVIFDDNKVN